MPLPRHLLNSSLGEVQNSHPRPASASLETVSRPVGETQRSDICRNMPEGVMHERRETSEERLSAGPVFS